MVNGKFGKRLLRSGAAAAMFSIAMQAHAQDVTNVRMVLWPGPEGDAMQKVVDTYNKGQGTEDGINVEMVLLSRDDTFAKEATEIATGSSNVDIYFTATYNVGFFARGLQSIDDIGLDTSLYFPTAIDGLTIDGALYGLPLDVSNHFLYYRSDLMEELLGSEEQIAEFRDISEKVLGEARDPKAPEEWDTDDYLAAAAYFSRAENEDSPTRYGTVLQAKTSPFNITLWDDLLWGLGGSWTAEDGSANLHSPEAERSMEIFRTIYEERYTSPDSAQWEYGETNAALQAGSAAFALQWSAAYAELTDPERSPEVYDKIAVAPMPGDPHSTHVHTLAISLNKESQNKEAAKTWMAYLATPEAMDAYAKAGGIPSQPAVLKDNTDINPAFDAIAAHVQQYGYSIPIFPGTFEAMTALTEELSGGWVGVTDIDAALEQANSRLEALLER
ncbi:ABC transporter substrate-binding protein [Notoacmeibacter ruber]|uniref:Extracellular solute-binding protein n=1 Tax=Notoacmeibacter ruber TaxID=2670375 RepID=A0A3L7J462_9HYPH|nr:extracellular solute-binding protein [Notoacmeibacter ruber]RLQ85304.1 extracellular solute-binding protein [Notoacmeibacter ruber]